LAYLALALCCMFLTAKPLLAQSRYGEIVLTVDHDVQGEPAHGYTEYRIKAVNHSTDRTHRVRLVLPGESGRGSEGTLAAISREVNCARDMRAWCRSCSRPCLPCMGSTWRSTSTGASRMVGND